VRRKSKPFHRRGRGERPQSALRHKKSSVRFSEETVFPIWDGVYCLVITLPLPLVYWNHGVRGKSASNLWGSMICGQNLGFKELSTVGLRFGSRYGREVRSAHYHALDDDDATRLWKARSDVTTAAVRIFVLGYERGPCWLRFTAPLK